MAAATTSTRSTIPAPPPYGSSSTWPARSGGVSRYENRRRSSSAPRTAATGRRSVSHGNAWGTRGVTASCTGGEVTLDRVDVARRPEDPGVFEVDPTNALLHHRQRHAGVKLEHVVGDTRGDVDHVTERRTALLHDLGADQLKDVVGAFLG